ncbi:helix-turn-helix transcriptional regulator [Lederbergia wuyishanensis]|uniref:DNA-binding XRE family transcriptional regulator n=1 Tax=Lederbergia wuyishanensis TaxID=1347903 RepID=A0ABU0D4I6_9BACI|nr:helix-turn-helix transcriptional regulator [Lederbergia wuyishanensis]MCJ8008089.1 helix-turn-helix domain-containing protein [Lederbergia wuyishanensis]MDQ0343326.1 DNA-binding XRE family transcriptional regulator [Lederbergia wuyishanensis]
MIFKQWTIGELRESTGYNQAKFAKEILHVSPKTLWLYEQDSSSLPDDLIKKYMYLFNVTYEEIFFGPKYEKIVHVQRKIAERIEMLKNIEVIEQSS